jgi:hypothetical protein
MFVASNTYTIKEAKTRTLLPCQEKGEGWGGQCDDDDDDDDEN